MNGGKGMAEGQIDLTLDLSKEGADTNHYKERGLTSIGRLYLKRIVSHYVFGDDPPKVIHVTIRPGE